MALLFAMAYHEMLLTSAQSEGLLFDDLLISIC